MNFVLQLFYISKIFKGAVGDIMFIRKYETTNKKTGTTYVTHRLVEAYRTEEGLVRQRVIMQLGTLSLPKSEWRKHAIALESSLTDKYCSKALIHTELR